MLLGFHPSLYIKHNWDNLINQVTDIANSFVKTELYKNHILYEHGASIVAEVPGGGWISKSGPSDDFFVFGGIDELNELGHLFEKTFPELSFTPATMCFTSKNVPVHKDNIKNGQASLVYPLHVADSIGVVIDPNNESDFFYTGKNMWPTIINITEYHRVYNSEPRIWFSIHFHEPIEEVKKAFDLRKGVEI